MTNKTAMMELIEVLEDFVKELDKKYDGDPWVKRGVFIAINEAKDRLGKEKEQIIMAYDNGRYSSLQYNKTPIEYYNQNYSKEVQDETK
jgi:hypothetical protein